LLSSGKQHRLASILPLSGKQHRLCIDLAVYRGKQHRLALILLLSIQSALALHDSCCYQAGGHRCRADLAVIREMARQLLINYDHFYDFPSAMTISTSRLSGFAWCELMGSRFGADRTDGRWRVHRGRYPRSCCYQARNRYGESSRDRRSSSRGRYPQVLLLSGRKASTSLSVLTTPATFYRFRSFLRQFCRKYGTETDKESKSDQN
jgi:hypothetical protein